MFDTVESIPKKSQSNLAWTSNTNLIIFAFSLVFYGRIFTTVTPAPSILVHAHFVVVPLVLWIVLATAPQQNPDRVKLVRSLLLGLFVLFLAILASALWNRAALLMQLPAS